MKKKDIEELASIRYALQDVAVRLRDLADRNQRESDELNQNAAQIESVEEYLNNL